MNKIINIALFKEQLKRFWGLSALIFTYYAHTIALPIYVESRYTDGFLRSVSSLINMENGFLIFSMLFAPLIAVIVLFKYQNQIKSATAMHSYPLTRNQLLATNTLAGMTLLTLPLLALCIIVIFPMQQFYPGILISIRVLARFFFIATLSFLFYFSIYVVVAMLSGSSIITLLLCVTLPSLPIALYLLTGIALEFYVFGFHMSWINPLDFFVYIYPVLLLMYWREGYMPFIWVSYSAVITVMATCSVFATNKRTHERTIDSVVFPLLKNILVFILSVFGLILVGFIFFNTYDTLAMYIGFVIGFFITYCIAQMIVEKTFDIRNKLRDFKKFGSIAFGILLLIIISTRSDTFGYERYIPHIEDIEGVQILDVGFLFDNRDKLANSDLNELLVKDIEIINETIGLHLDIISNRALLMRVERYKTFGRRFNILYKLKNGNVVVRRYYLHHVFMNDNDVYGLQVSSRLSTSLLQNRPDLIDSIRISTTELRQTGYHQPSGISIDRPDHILAFIDALMKDRDLIDYQGGDSIHAEIIFTPEDLNTLRRMESLSFSIGNNGQSYIRDWLNETNYLD